MPILIEYKVLSRSGQEITSEAYCPRHWQTRGRSLFDADTGRKEIRRHDVEHPEDLCAICQEELQVPA